MRTQWRTHAHQLNQTLPCCAYRARISAVRWDAIARAFLHGSDFVKLKQKARQLHAAYIADFTKARAATAETLGLLKKIDVSLCAISLCALTNACAGSLSPSIVCWSLAGAVGCQRKPDLGQLCKGRLLASSAGESPTAAATTCSASDRYLRRPRPGPGPELVDTAAVRAAGTGALSERDAMGD